MTDKISKNELAINAVKEFGAEGYETVLAVLLPVFPPSPSVTAGRMTIENFIRGYIMWAANREGITLAGATKERKVKEKAAPKIKSPKLVAAVVGSLEDKPRITNMTVEEIADKTAKRSKKKSKATGPAANSSAPGVENFDPEEARAYVDAVTESMDNFIPPSETDHPASLSADEVAALV